MFEEGWKVWKRGYDAWEAQANQVFEAWLKSPLMLTPAGAMMSAWLKARAQREKAMGMWWSSMGLPTREDQDRTLHALNDLQSRLIDLEDQLHDLRAEQPPKGGR